MGAGAPAYDSRLGADVSGLAIGLGMGDGEPTSENFKFTTIEVADRLAAALEARCDRDNKSPAAVMVDILAEAFPPEIVPIRFGESTFTMVMSFSTGQTLKFDLILKDRDFVGNEIYMTGAALEGARLIVGSVKEANQTCRNGGFHFVVPVLPTRAAKYIGSNPFSMVCKACGTKVVVEMEKAETDVDAFVAKTVASRVLLDDGRPDLGDSLNDVDRLRRRLSVRQAELAEAQKQLERAAEKLASQMMKLAPT